MAEDEQMVTLQQPRNLLLLRRRQVHQVRPLYLSIKNWSAATTLSSAVFDRYATAPLSFGATFWNPGVKTEKTAKKTRKNGAKLGEIWPKKKSAPAVL
eukprot:COSAG04_NODE_181_length_21260_cov_200.681820_12_plen_98_part_00